MVVVSAKSSPDTWSGFLLIFFPPPAPSPPSPGRFLSICFLLLLTTFLLFTLSTFEPSSSSSSLHHSNRSHAALQGMGILHRRGSRAMPDLIVAHVPHSLDHSGFRTFLRILHSSGHLARSDLAFLFPSPSISSRFTPLIRQENDSLLTLLSRFHHFNRTAHNSRGLAGLARYSYLRKDDKKDPKEAIWGKGFRHGNRSESTRPSYGSVVGFDASELDPENSLSGFLDHVPMGLRRWACYPMLLGRLKRSYKHVLLADVQRVLLLNDPFAATVRNRSPESVYFWANPESDPESGKRGRRQHEPTIIPGVVAGGSRGVRRLSDAVLTEIVRAAIEHKGKSAITESGILNRLLRSPHLLKNVNVIASGEPDQDAGAAFGSDSDSGSVYSGAVVVQPGHGVNNSIKRLLWCWSDIHTEVYRDCLHTQ